MEVSLQELLKCNFFSAAQVLVGEQNLSNLVTSVTVLDSPDAPKYIKPGNLVITTAYSLLDDDTVQKEVISKLAEAGAAGLGIKLRFFNGQLPKIMKDTAKKYEFPIISLPNEYAYTDIYEFITNHLLARTTGEVRRYDEVFRELNENLSLKGLAGLSEILYKWTGFRTIILYNNRLHVFPGKVEDEELWKEKTFWHKKSHINGSPAGINRYCCKYKDMEQEILVGDIFDKSLVKGRIILLKGDRDFVRDDYVLLESAASACSIEIKRIQSLVQVQRKYEKKFLLHFFNKDYSLEEAKYHAKELDFFLPAEGFVIIIEIASTDFLEDSQYCEYIEKAIIDILGFKTPFSYLDSHRIAILIPDDLEKFSPLLEKLYSQLKDICNSEDVLFGIGRKASLENINKSFEEAKKAIEIGACLDLPSKIYFFSQLGFYRLLKIPDIYEEMVRYYEDYLKPIVKEGETSNDLLDTLKCYIECGFNYTETAHKMYVHPNTVRYRISVIEKNCRVNFKYAYDRLNMEIALKLLPLIK